MVCYENVWFGFIVRSFIDPLLKNKYEREPQVGPNPAKSQYHVPSPDPAEKAGDNNKRKDQQHDGDK
jgi:hypothetical protein